MKKANNPFTAVPGADSDPDFERLHDRVLDYCKSKSANTKQGSNGWILSRCINVRDNFMYVAVGGSELAQLLGKNKYASRDTLVADKVEILSRGTREESHDVSRMVNTTWGHIMEPFSREYICRKYNTVFYEIDASIPHRDVPWFRLSPDGIGLLRIHNVWLNRDKLYIVALELKNRYQCGASKDCIPDYYLPQVMAATDVIDVSAFTLYCECVFRVQSLNQWGLPRYNSRINMFSINGKRGNERYDGLSLMSSCVVCFGYDSKRFGDVDFLDHLRSGNLMTSAEASLLECLVCTMSMAFNYEHDLIDVGNGDSYHFELFIEAVSRGDLIVWPDYDLTGAEIPPKYVSTRLDRFKEDAPNHGLKPVAFMCAGLFQTYENLVVRDPQYVKGFSEQFETFHREVLERVKANGGLDESFTEIAGGAEWFE